MQKMCFGCYVSGTNAMLFIKKLACQLVFVVKKCNFVS